MPIDETQEAMRDAARSFASERLAPGAMDCDRSKTFPRDQLRETGQLGFMGMLVPKAYGGSETGMVSYALALEETAAAEGATSTIMSVHSSVGCLPILKFGTEAQKQRFLPKLASGEWIGGFALTEPHAGSDASNLRTKARRDDDHYVIDGAKQFITSGKNGQMIIVFAVTDPSAGKRGISAFIVPTDMPGYEVISVEHKLGLNASDTCALSLSGMRVPAENLLGAEGEGYKIALSNLEGGRIGIAAQAVGKARAAMEAAVAYAKQRTSFGKPIIDHQAVGFSLADMAVQVDAARLLVLWAAALRDAGKPCLTEASMAKLYASEMAERVCSAAIQVFGGYGCLVDYQVERIYRDVRVTQIYEGTSEVQRMVTMRGL